MTLFMQNLELLSPLIQMGFAGFSAVLLAIIVWLMRNIFKANERNQNLLVQTQEVIQANTDAIRELAELSRDTLKLSRSVHDQLLMRPCIAHREP